MNLNERSGEKSQKMDVWTRCEACAAKPGMSAVKNSIATVFFQMTPEEVEAEFINSPNGQQLQKAGKLNDPRILSLLEKVRVELRFRCFCQSCSLHSKTAQRLSRTQPRVTPEEMIGHRLNYTIMTR